MVTSGKKLSILHIVLSIGETNTTYNEHCLPVADQRDISIVSFFRSSIRPAANIHYYEGNDSFPGFFRALQMALRENTYDAVHMHTPHVAVLFLLAALVLSRARRLLGSTVLTVHGSYPDYKLRNKLLYLAPFAFFKHIVCCSQSSYHSFPKFYRWLAGDRLMYIRNGVDIPRVDEILAHATPQTTRPTCFTGITVCRMVEIKNLPTILAAFQQSADPAVRLVLVGDGPEREGLIARSKTLGMDGQVQFPGLMARNQVFESLLDADLFLSASHGEGMPIAVLEAMACRRPVVLSDIPSHREIAAYYDRIPLVPPNDAAGFAREIRAFRAMSPAERRTIGEKCRILVEEQFSLSAMHARYAEVYSQISRRHDN